LKCENGFHIRIQSVATLVSAKSLVWQGYFPFENESNEEIKEKQISIRQWSKGEFRFL